MKLINSKNLFVFAMGFFAIAAQTLLFREFISSFESNDIAVAVFFSSWFLWIAVAACFLGIFDKLAAFFANNIRIILLCYIPAYALQLFLIIQAREIADIPSYVLFPITSMILAAMLVNLPVSFLTGIVFSSACRWLTESTKIPVSKVYLLEALGSIGGGLAVTIILICQINSILIFLLCSLLIAIAVSLVFDDTIKRRTALFPALILAVLIVGRFDLSFQQKIQKLKWSKLLPAETYQGSFATPQSEYLYGDYNRQFLIVQNGAVCTSIPDRESGAAAIATNLCQNPLATRVLIIGSGFNICNELIESSQIKRIYWFYPDNQFIEKVNNLLPVDQQVSSSRITVIKEDIRTFLSDDKNVIDSVIINLGNPDSASLNRYCTVNFFNLLKHRMSSEGVLGIQVSGGENVMGKELAYLGASVKFSLGQVFKKVIIKSGEKTWFLASDNVNISDDPEVLSANFAKFANAAGIFPSSGLFSLYQPSRSADAARIYHQADLPEDYLINRDSEPHVFLYELLLACKQSGWKIVPLVKDLLNAGLAPYLALTIAFSIIWIIYAKGSKNCGAVGENFLLVLLSGFLGISSLIVLMFLFQTRYGSLFLHIGLISSLFMIGLSIGTYLARYLSIQQQIKSDKLVLAVIPIQIAVFALIAFGKPFAWNYPLFAVAFLLPGLCNGIFFPIAATRLEQLKVTSGKSGSLLENADHLGASAGSLITGICLIPLLGTRYSLFLCAVILAINIPISLYRISQGEKMKTQTISLKRQLAFFFIGTIILVFSFILTVKLVGEEQAPVKKESEEQAAQVEKQKPKTVEEMLGPPPKAAEKTKEDDKQTMDESPPPGSEVKKVNLPKVKKMIKEKKLSDHEAEFYKKFE